MGKLAELSGAFTVALPVQGVKVDIEGEDRKRASGG